MDNLKVNIYALSASSDPTEFRYVGMTKLPLDERLNSHKLAALSHQETPTLIWIKQILESGDDVIITLLAICEHYEFEAVEASYIRQMRSAGYRLLNVDNGGSGGTVVYDEFKQSVKRSKWFKSLPPIEQMVMRMKWVTYNSRWTINVPELLKKQREVSYGY